MKIDFYKKKHKRKKMKIDCKLYIKKKWRLDGSVDIGVAILVGEGERDC